MSKTSTANTLTITIKQYTTQRRAQGFCGLINAEVKKRWGDRVKIFINKLDAEVYQVELVGEFPNDINVMF